MKEETYKQYTVLSILAIAVAAAAAFLARRRK
ncbi:MAG: LPXTG cell wall anchor domain-containing protein [Archaeoglobales archaeon]|nr:LPXTG cell wall anchor domain-containing protein [Archaeoglobi archaeon]NHW23714.1 LPXTG cell wall anchor domain-containing protein [Archaeoglobales archaeon]